MLTMDDQSVVSLWGVLGASFVFCLVLLHVLTRVARVVNLLDVPDVRKQHKSPTPLVGGIGIFVSFFAVSTIFAFDQTNWSLVLWLTVVLAVGIWDDLSDLSYKTRLFVHLLVVVGIWLTDGQAVFSIGAIVDPESMVSFSTVGAVLFTAVAVTGAVNAVNMIDGVDGLLGSLMFISFVSLLLMPFVFDGDKPNSFSALEPIHITVLLGGISGFLVLNSRFLYHSVAKIYTGDSGSTVLGFLLVYILIDFTQGENALFSPVVAGWIVGVPLLDASAVILSRMLKRETPVKAGRDHLHHILLDKGFGVNQTVLVLAAAQVAMIIFAVSLERSNYVYTDMLLFWGFVSLVLLRSMWCFGLVNKVQPSLRGPRDYEYKLDLSMDGGSIKTQRENQRRLTDTGTA